MARSQTATRINWLFPHEDVYQTHTLGPGAAMRPAIAYCCRCGGPIHAARRGNWRPVVFQMRERGSRWKGKHEAAIHFGCVPTFASSYGIRPRR